MQLNRKIFCHWDFCRFVTEEHLLQDGGYTLSLTDSNKYELMIFLGKADDYSGYEVIVYKAQSTDKYKPHEFDDKVTRYEENDDCVIFFFKNFSDAHEFVTIVMCSHDEFKTRPVRKINSN